MNSFINMQAFPPAEMKIVVRPNFDTLYSSRRHRCLVMGSNRFCSTSGIFGRSQEARLGRTKGSRPSRRGDAKRHESA
jgi:Protein of unknown function (DUF1254)